MTKAAGVKAFDREFKAKFEPLTKKLTDKLIKIIKAKIPVEIGAVNFEVEPDWRSFPIWVYARDRNGRSSIPARAPLSGTLLKGTGPLVKWGEIDMDKYEDAGIGTYERGAALLISWFDLCWRAAGGKDFSRPAAINLHDSTDWFDLRARKWVNASKWCEGVREAPAE